MELSMTEQPADWREGLPASVVDEVDQIIGAFAARREGEPSGREGPGDGPVTIGVARKGNQLDYLYAEGQILVQDQYLARVLEALGLPDEVTLRQDERQPIRPVTAGVVLLAPAPTEAERQFLVPDALATIDRYFGAGVATPDHVLTVANGHPAFCPATEPEEAYYDAEPFPPVCHDNGGSAALVYVADTGLLRDAGTDHAWLAGVQVANPATDYDAYQPPTPGHQAVPPIIPPYTGHGTFVAGVLRCVAPAADVVVAKVSLAAGSTLESQLVMRLTAALGLAPDIFHVTLACPSRLDLPLIGFRAWLRQLRDYGGAVCVAPAGNSGIRRPSWPAAFADVVSVGALGSDWHGRASFSNFGSWVDVYAPGRDLINAYTTGTYQCEVSPYAGTDRKFYGMAKWSGTSFSTPIVSGLIAARMSATGENARTATAALLTQARAEAVPGVGPVLLPACKKTRPCGCSSGCSCCGR
jgi:subtilisin family serine protease